MSSDQFFSTMNEGLRDNHTPEQLSKIDTHLRELEAIFKKVKQAKSGDVITIDFVPAAGTRIAVNGETKGHIIGDALYTALLRMWLGDKPADAGLKKALLGG